MRSKCSVNGCDRDLCSNGYCQLHLRRLNKTGSVELLSKQIKLCSIDGCGKEFWSKGLCRKHYKQDAKDKETRVCSIDGCNRKWYTSVDGKEYCRPHRQLLINESDLKTIPTGSGHINGSGYREVYVNGRMVLEHRHIMEVSLGRRLIDNENVHHINGDRADNRLSNLELWDTSQPSGQRVEDKIRWMKEFISLYDGLESEEDDSFGRY